MSPMLAAAAMLMALIFSAPVLCAAAPKAAAMPELAPQAAPAHGTPGSTAAAPAVERA